MIWVKRASWPKVLLTKGEKWKSDIRAASTPQGREKAQNKYRHSQIKDALVAMFHGKCAYCESAITHIDYGHIEHFKPKGIPEYYDLAVDWSNLLLACGRCNGPENKGIKFPGPSSGGPLVNPTEDDPGQHFRFDFDRVTKLANVLGISERGETTWRLLGLNRRELVRRRSDFVKKLWVIATRYDSDAEAREIIDNAVSDGEEYTAFARELKRVLTARSQRLV